MEAPRGAALEEEEAAELIFEPWKSRRHAELKQVILDMAHVLSLASNNLPFWREASKLDELWCASGTFWRAVCSARETTLKFSSLRRSTCELNEAPLFVFTAEVQDLLQRFQQCHDYARIFFDEADIKLAISIESLRLFDEEIPDLSSLGIRATTNREIVWLKHAPFCLGKSK